MNQLESTLRLLADDPFAETVPSNLADRALTRARQRSRRRGALAAVGAATVATLVVVGGTATARQHRATPAPAATTATFAKPRMNVLLIGSDAAPGRIGVRPDLLKLASIDSRTGDTVLVTVPTELTPASIGRAGKSAWPKGFRCNECRLRDLWSWAEKEPEYQKYENPGLQATTQLMTQLTGLTVDDTVVLNMQALADLVDAVGGVDITVNQRLPIGGSDDRNSPDYHRAQGWIEAGRRHLDGNQAVWFARSRWNPDEDPMTSRVRQLGRQQCLLTSLIDQVDGPRILAGYPKIAASLGRNLSTSIPADELGAWTELLIRMQDARTASVELDPVGFGHSADEFDEFRQRITQAVAHQSADPYVAWAEKNVPSSSYPSRDGC